MVGSIRLKQCSGKVVVSMLKKDLEDLIREYDSKKGFWRKISGPIGGATPEIQILRDICNHKLRKLTSGDLIPAAELTTILRVIKKSQLSSGLTFRLLTRFNSQYSRETSSNSPEITLTRSNPELHPPSASFAVEDVATTTESPLIICSQANMRQAESESDSSSVDIESDIILQPLPKYRKEFKLDSNTGPSENTAFKTVQQLFIGTPEIPVSEYRLQVYTHYQNGLCYCEPNIVERPLPLLEVKRIDLAIGIYYSNLTLVNNLESRYAWHVLPSISSEEELIAIKSTGPIRFGHSIDTDMYYVSLDYAAMHKDDDDDTPEPEEIFIEFNLKYQADPKLTLNSAQLMRSSSDRFSLQLRRIDANDKPDLSEIRTLKPEKQCQVLQNFFQSFVAQKFTTTRVVAEASHELTLTLSAKKLGLCRQRAILFMWYAHELGLRARADKNEVHAWVEVMLDQRWLDVDLGGIPMSRPRILPLKVPVNTNPPAALLAQSMQTVVRNTLSSSEGGRELIQGVFVDGGIFSVDLETNVEKPTVFQAQK